MTSKTVPQANAGNFQSAAHEPLPPLLTEKEAARYLGTSTQYLVKWRFLQQPIVPFVRIGRMIRYRQADLDEYVTSHRFVGLQKREVSRA